ncbi:hypothetical protein ACIPY5_19860 [Microbacterium sp. NPDC089698]|uniref:hypothetical protein n=1 Tax=Microbacterium sp. NPDC089698 TaxID=3364200 RepID=UPI003807617A
MKIAVAFTAAFLLFAAAAVGVIGMLLTAAPAAAACTTPGTPITAATGDGPLQLSASQKANAQTIIGVAKTVFPDPAIANAAATVAVATAIQESGLESLDHGDRDSLGLFQQRPSAGYVNATDPVWAATQFLTRLAAIPSWTTLSVGQAAMSVQIAAEYPNGTDRPSYVDQVIGHATEAAAIVGTLTGASPAIPLPAGSTDPNLRPVDVNTAPAAKTTCTGAAAFSQASAQQAAQVLVAGWEAGTLVDFESSMITEEIIPIAQGKPIRPECEIDPRILQLMAGLLQKYGSLGVSDINRPCVGIALNCAFSLHCAHPSKALDIVSVGGRGVDGGNAASLELLAYLDQVMPNGSGTGQSNCRGDMSFKNFHTFEDSCNHVHIDLGDATDPLSATKA